MMRLPVLHTGRDMDWMTIKLLNNISKHIISLYQKELTKSSTNTGKFESVKHK
jgi:hypothetical protein